MALRAANDYFTQATIEGDTLRFGLPAATRKACSPQLMAQEPPSLPPSWLSALMTRPEKACVSSMLPKSLIGLIRNKS